MAILKDFENIYIIPILHRNLINFMGMLPRDEYLCTKRQNDKFIALSKSGYLTTWNILTGKLLC